jgi:pimeloyl-ACP methyl ester carboxylesterase
VDEEHRRADAERPVPDQVLADAHPRDARTWTPVDGLVIHGRELAPARDAGEPIVMLHGLGVAIGSLGPLAERLAERHPVFAFDMPGFGLSASSELWSTPRIAALTERLMPLRGFGRAVLLGHSYGCHVAAAVAAAHPERVSALVLLSPAFDRRFGSPAAQIARLVLDSPMERPSLVAGGLRDQLRAGPRRALRTLREASGIPLGGLLERCPAPTLIVRGSRDPLTTARWAEELRGRAAGPARVALIPGAAHGLGHDAPTAVAGALEAFLGSSAGHPTRMPRPGSPAP